MDPDYTFLCDSSPPNSGEITPEQNKVSETKGWTKLLILASISTTIGAAIPVGYNIGVINTPASILRAWCNESVLSEYDISMSDGQMDVLWSSVVSIFLIGGMTGSLGGAWLADKVGRKGALNISGIISFVGSAFFLLTKVLHSVELMFLGRIFVGLSSGLVTAVMPMYLTEISPAHLRGSTGVLCQLGITFGVLLGQVMGLSFVLGTEGSWNYLLAFQGVPVLLTAFSVPWLPESPKYLHAIKGFKQKAVKELSRLRELPEDWVCRELETIETGGSEPWTVLRLLSTPSLRLHLALVCALQAGQQFSGINAVFYYSVSIFERAGLSPLNSQYATLGAGLMNFGIAVVIIPVVNYFPRKSMALLSCSLATLMLISLTITITCMETVHWISYMSIVVVLLYVLLYGIGLGPIPYFIASELFEVGPRPGAMALGSVANWSGNFIVGMTFPSLQRAIGQYSFLTFATSTFLLTVFLKLCLPETNPRVLAKRGEGSGTSSPGDFTPRPDSEKIVP